jgi:FdhD protein
MRDVVKFPIYRVTEEGRTETEDTVVREMPLTIFLNEKELVTMACSPSNLDSLAVGFLFSEGLLRNRDQIQSITLDSQKGLVWVRTADGVEPDEGLLSRRLIVSGCGRGTSFYRVADVQSQARIESPIVISAGEAVDLVHRFQHASKVYQATGGVHSAALCDIKEILVIAEDIGRHNAIDKILGHCILKGIPVDDRIIITSGRVSSEILLKVARGRIPIVISISAPTHLGVELAGNLGITLVGFVRGKRMNVYTNAQRVY